MLTVDVRDLRHGPIETRARVAVDDPIFAGLDLQLAEPLRVDGKLQATGAGEYFWQGHLAGDVRATCRRCLAELLVPVSAEVGVMFSADPDAQDDPGVYPLAPTASAINLGEAVREELALVVPGYPLCRDDCKGLCARCGADLNAGPCACAATPDNT